MTVQTGTEDTLILALPTEFTRFCLKSFWRFAKWISAAIMPPLSSVSARSSRPDPVSAGQG